MSTREFPVNDFSAINAKWPMDLKIQQSEKCSVSITGSDRQLESVNLSVDGDRLTLSLKVNLVTCLVAPFTRMSAVINLPSLHELELSGASHCKIGEFKSSNDFRLKVEGASSLEFLDFSAGRLNFELSGASNIKGKIEASGDWSLKIAGASKLSLNGSAKDLAVEAAGASSLDLVDFKVKNARLKLSGASKGSFYLDGKMEVDLEGASRLDYSGQVILGETRVTGASSLKRK